jgi:hypothetical protein
LSEQIGLAVAHHLNLCPGPQAGNGRAVKMGDK